MIGKQEDGFGVWFKEVESAYRNYRISIIRLGLLHIGEYGICIWILIKTKVNSLTNKTSTYPVLKFFKGNFLIELGYNNKTDGIRT